MEIRERQTGSGTTIVELEGMLVLGRESQLVESTVEKLVQDGKKKIIVDLSKVSYIDSSGVGILVGSLGHCKLGGGAMRLIGVRGNILKIMQLTRVDEVLPVDTSLKEGYIILVTGDHGNIESMFYPDGSPNPSHGLNPVPFILISDEPDLRSVTLRDDLGLSSVAPTILELMGLQKPHEMTGETIITR